MRPLPRKSDPQRDPAPDVVLIGYQDQGNLGMGYLAAVLQQHGYVVDMVDIRDGADVIASRLIARPPLLVGFSLIWNVFFSPYGSFERLIAPYYVLVLILASRSLKTENEPEPLQ